MGKELKRMRYFDGLLLDASCYQLDQDYQRRLLQNHNCYMHTSGIIAGLEVTPYIASLNDDQHTLSDIVCNVVTEDGQKTYRVPENIQESKSCEVIVSEGMALDVIKEDGISRQIYIFKDQPDSKVNLSVHPANKDIYIYVKYAEEDGKQKEDKQFINGYEQSIHTLERGCLGHDENKPEDENKNIIIGKVKLGLANSINTKISTTLYQKDEVGSIKPTTLPDNEITIITNEAFKETTTHETLTKRTEKETGNKIIDMTVTLTDEDTKLKTITNTITTLNDVDNIITKVETITKGKEKKIVTTKTTTIDKDESTKEVTVKTDGQTTDVEDKSKIFWTTNGTVVETTNIAGNVYTKKTDITTTEGTTKTIIDELAEKIQNVNTGKPEIKTKGTNTVTSIAETKDSNGTVVETKEITTVTEIDKTTTTIEDTIGQHKSKTEGASTVTTKTTVKNNNPGEQSITESDVKTVKIDIEETTILDNGLPIKIITITNEDDTKTIKTTTVTKSIVSVVDETVGIATKTNTVETKVEIVDKVSNIKESFTPTIETITDKKPTNELAADIICDAIVKPIKYVKEISCFDSSGNSVRKYSGPSGTELTIGKMIFKMSNQNSGMPFIRTYEEAKKIGLEVESPFTNFTGSVKVNGDLIIKGQLKDSNGGIGGELQVSNSYIQVNSKTDEWKLRDGGLQVYRGETKESPDACLRWSEKRKKWQVGYMYKDANNTNIDVNFYDLAYGDRWENLINHSLVDDLHKHSMLFDSHNVVALEAKETGELLTYRNLSLNDNTMWLRSSGNTNHGLGWYGTGKTFANIAVDGPVLFGLNGGILGTSENGQKAVITWNSNGNVGIGVKSPIDDRLELAGTLKILSDTNPIRFTSNWTGIKNPYLKDAEISNDTSKYQALTIVGNSSAGIKDISGNLIRRVAIWDRLDVNGYLYVNGDMHVSSAIKPSAGDGANGIIFPSDPGGGSGDSAWLKYYARTGEACNLEIGTSNDSNDNICLMTSGNVGIGTYKPADLLDVNGNMRVLSGTNPIRFTSSWDGASSLVSNQAEICNDISREKALILIGNKSSGRRKVSVWDDLYVNGSLTLNGDLKTQCAITPSAGRGENNGISFPKEYNGDSGDSAWIKYFSDELRGGRENMTLEIGIGNDPGDGRYNGAGDRIRLHASGGVWVDGYFYYSSSRELKENIKELPTDKAKTILNGLNPVAFNFIGDTEKTTLGFIAEEVPAEVAALDQKAISPMEIVAVLTSVVKDQRKLISELQQQVESIS